MTPLDMLALSILGVGVLIIVITVWQDLPGRFVFLGLCLVIIGLFLGLYSGTKNDRKRCAAILSMARTNSDSITVLTQCGQSNTQYIPIPIYISR